MPQFDTTTKEARSVWKSPDGQREIFEVALEYNGETFKASTYSKDIANPGWSGKVETYEKPGNNGRPSQTFVKQAPKEDGFFPQPQGSPQSSTGQGSSKPAYVPKDEKAIQAMWAITKAVEITGPVAEPDFDKLLSYASTFMDMVDVVKDSSVERDTPSEPEPNQPGLDIVHEVDDDAEISLEDLDRVFPKSEPVGEKSWQAKS